MFASPSQPRESALLSSYFDSLSRHAVPSPDEEQAQTRRVAELRDRYWEALTSSPVLLPIVVRELPEALLDAPQVAGILRKAKAAVKTGHGLDDRAAVGLARLLSSHDVDGDLADQILNRANRLDGRIPVKRPHRPLTRARRARREFRDAINAFATANLRLVVSIAKRYRRRDIPFEDLIQNGNLGLLKAITRFEPHRGLRFSTYAVWWIRHSLTRGIQCQERTVRVPVHIDATYAKVTKLRRQLRTTLGRDPTRSEVAEAANTTENRVEACEGAMESSVLSIDGAADRPDGQGLLEVLAASETPAVDQIVHERLRDRVGQLLLHLSPQEQHILSERFGLSGGESRTLAEIGTEYNLSRERIRQVQQQALSKLRRQLAREGTREFHV